MAGLVAWDLAARIARLIAADGPAEADGVDLAAADERAGAAVSSYTRLELREDVPAAEWVSRRQWVELNLRSMQAALAPLERRLGDGPSLPAPAGGAVGAAVGAAGGAQLGGLLGYASRHVLGQYELPLLGPQRPPRLIFVGENVAAAAAQLGGEPQAVLDWVALHEKTHAVHFAAAPWMRTHLSGLLEGLLAGAEPALDPGQLLASVRRLASTRPARIAAELAATDPVSLLATPATKRRIDATQAAMASIEGYAEHVMDAAAPDREAVDLLRERMERRRGDRSTLARLLGWVLGLEMKLRQYRDGKLFADAVVQRAGIDGLNAAWESPASLPALEELSDPEAWLARVGTSSRLPA